MARRQHRGTAPTADNFITQVNQAYPNRLKVVHNNYSVGDDGLYYVTVEDGTTHGSHKTLVVGDSGGILATSSVTVTGWGGPIVNVAFAHHGFFGFGGRTANSGGSNNYLSVFKYENGTITSLVTDNSVNLRNWLRGDLSCFTFGGKDYVQGVTNKSCNTLWFYNLTDLELTRNEGSQHLSGCVIEPSNGSIKYFVKGVNPHTTGVGIRVSSIPSVSSAISTTALSNVITYNNDATIRKMPLTDGSFKYYLFYSSSFYPMTVSSDYTTITLGDTPDITTSKTPGIYSAINFIFDGDDLLYCSTSTYDLVKVPF